MRTTALETGWAPAGEQADRHAPPGARLPLAVPADRVRDLLDVPDEVGVERLAACAQLLARRTEVLASHVQRVDAGAARELVHLQLADPLQVCRSEGAVGAGRGGIRVDARGVDAVRLPAVGAWRGVTGGRGDARSVVGIRTRVEPALDVATEQPALGAHPRPHAAAHPVTARRHHRLRHAVLNPHRPPRLARERDGDRLHLRIRLRAEAAAQVRDDDAHVGDRYLEQRGDLCAHEEGVLTRSPERDLVALDLGDDRVRLHRVLVDGGERVLALDHVLGVGEDSFDLPTVDAVAVADVAVGGLQLAEAVEETRAQRPVVELRRVLGQRLLDRAHDCELLVLDVDALQGRQRRRLVLGGDRRDGLARETDAIDGHDRPVLDRMTPVRIDVLQVGCREDADDAGHALGFGRVDGDDPRVRNRRAQHLPVRHAWHDDVAREQRLAAQLLGGVPAGNRAADRTAGRGGDDFAHAATPARSQTAS